MRCCKPDIVLLRQLAQLRYWKPNLRTVVQARSDFPNAQYKYILGYIWSIVLHGAENWTLRKVAGKCLNVVLE
jgi:hypothetical protein